MAFTWGHGLGDRKIKHVSFSIARFGNLKDIDVKIKINPPLKYGTARHIIVAH